MPSRPPRTAATLLGSRLVFTSERLRLGQRQALCLGQRQALCLFTPSAAMG
jgi:hypothetical protein